MNGPTQKAYDAINSIRARKGVDMPPLPTGLNQTQMREKIRHERRIELAFEGHRYFDLKRWRIIGEIMNNFDEPTLPLYKSVFEDRFICGRYRKVRLTRTMAFWFRTRITNKTEI